MIRHLYPDTKVRARALGAWAAVSGLALAMGPVIGGVLVGVYSWRAVFWFNLFFGLVALVGAAVVLPETSDRGGAHLDMAGFVLGAGALCSVTYATIAGESSGYLRWWIDLLFAAAVVLGAAFVWVEQRAENPVLNLRYFRRKMFAGSNLVAFCTYFGTFSIFFFVALYLQVVGSTTGYGLALDFLPMATGMILSSLSGRPLGGPLGAPHPDDGGVRARRRRHPPDRLGPDPDLWAVHARLVPAPGRHRHRHRGRAGDRLGVVSPSRPSTRGWPPR